MDLFRTADGRYGDITSISWYMVQLIIIIWQYLVGLTVGLNLNYIYKCHTEENLLTRTTSTLS